MKDKSISYARKRIETQIEFQEKERKRKLENTRLELARAGISAYQRRKLTEAVNHFLTYIKILEEIKDVSPGGLLPSHFDAKQDLPELLMISGVYWDLVKLYDRTKSKERQKEFHHYLEKYVAFSKGMPFQHLCAEALRKYLTGDKPVHREEFRYAYKILSVHQCFVATALNDLLKPGSLENLRRYRDESLAHSVWGRAFIRFYYRVGPSLALQTDRLSPKTRRFLARVVDQVADRVH
ncbi:MAG: hypothetical protein HYX41_02320 [Bdellovibrio sp.]|nr:hypothetical protein [Bdellovibrio sp.]